MCSCLDAVACEETMKKVTVKRVSRFDESTDIYTEFFKPYELTAFDDTFCIAMTNSARCTHWHAREKTRTVSFDIKGLTGSGTFV